MKDNNLYEIYIKIRSNNEINLVNETKFLNVVEMWLEYFSFVCDYAKFENKNLDQLNSKIISKSILYSFDILDGHKQDWKEPKSNRIVKQFLSIFPLQKKNFLPAGVSHKVIDKINFKLLAYKIEDVEIQINENFKFQFFESCIKELDVEKAIIIKKIIPDIFFATGIDKRHALPNILKGSPLSFLDFNYNYLKILLQENEVKIIGIQHGGNYGEWKNNPYEIYENKISDKYYGWGFFKENINQNRFKKITNFKTRDDIFWIGRNKSYKPNKIDFGNQAKDHLLSINHIKYFYKELNELSIQFLPHPRNSHPVYEDVFKDIIKTTDNLNRLQTAKLIIFDCLSHTLVYYCLLNEIPFIIVLNELPKEGLSSRALSFYNKLYENNMLLIKGDKNITDQINYVKKFANVNFNNFLSKDFLNYINFKFFSNNTIDKV